MAEDEELLAELRAISAKSSSTDRFAGGDAEENAPVMEKPKPKPAPQNSGSVARKPDKSESLPPWKRGQVKAPGNDDVVVVGAPPKVPEQEQEVAPPSGGGFQKSSTTNTFKGDRGGPAEDEELLAELRAISAGASANRFVEGADGPPPPKPPPPQRSAAPAPAFQKSSLPNTFKGDRGGQAEDDELLAELRAISAGGSTNRFAENQDANPPDGSCFSSAANPAQAPPSTSNFPSNPMPAQEEQEPVVVTRDELPSSLKDNNWRVRKQSYTVIRKIIVGAAGAKAPNGEIEADSVMPGLDELILIILMDKNANALDAALELALEYADFCRGAESSERAEQIVKALLKGNGFTSSRPSAAKVATALVLKLMEVGAGTDSVHSATGVLLELGITSKKPKVVALSASIILDAAYSFGAACLPLASVATALTKLLSHSNKKVRDTGMDLVAEFCRALGSKDPMNTVIEKMKKAQVGDLDKLLAKQPGPTPIKIGLRSQKSQSGQPQASPEDALAALQAGSEALAVERLAKRTAVDVLDAIRKTDYAARLKLAKWSEKAGALDTILECGGEKPYKLVQPSHSANYTPLITEMKNTLSHTHFAVVGKALQVLAMLADGVGEKLFPNLRPLLPKLFELSKDKKLTKFLAACLDSFFGNVLSFEHILDPDSALPDALDERMEKNALARTTSLEYLGRCVTRGESSGLRGKLTHRAAQSCAELCVKKLDDSDAKVRKAALDVLKSLQAIDDPELAGAVGPIIEGLQSSNPRAYKSLSTGAKKPAAASKAGRPPAAAKAGPGKSSAGPPEPKKEPSRIAAAATSRPARPAAATPMRSAATPLSKAAAVPSQSDSGSGVAPSLDEAVARCESLDIPQWRATDEDGGILAGLESTKWLFRQSAIKGLASFVSAREVLDSPSDIKTDTECMLTFVKEHTRGFKETNVNVLQSIMELFLALCDYHETANQPFPLWATKDGITISTEKIADKKLSAIAKTLLMGFCVVQFPHFVLANAADVIHKVKAPAAHEEMLKWFKLFCNEFGAASIGKGVSDTVTWLLQESKATNIKIKKAAMSAFGTLHVQLGPAFQAVALSTVKEQSLRDLLEGAFRDHPYDPMASSTEWPKRSIMLGRGNADSTRGGGGSALCLEVPKTDLIAALSADCVSRMGSKDGKTAWKQRKAAMEEVEDVMKRSSGMLDASNMKSMVELLRALRDRLSDSQSNLKPVAARIIGSILGAVDKEAQAKLGKVVYAPLINCAMNDSKKNMHDAAIESLRAGTSMAPLEGGGPNEFALESFVIALTGELTESELKVRCFFTICKNTAFCV
jgi:cytoskeleton-associated protein 5